MGRGRGAYGKGEGCLWEGGGLPARAYDMSQLGLCILDVYRITLLTVVQQAG